MIDKNENGYRFDLDNISEKNESMLNELPQWIIEDTTTYQRHEATLRQILHCYGYTLTDDKEYTWIELAEHIKKNYTLEGKTGWYIDYLMCLKDA
jgi:hypothetical protein